MVDSFLAVVDRLIALLTKRQSDRREIFLDIIAPMFHELQGVTFQYFSLFFDGKRAVLKPLSREELDAELKKLWQTHEQVVLARLKVLALAEEIGTQLPDKRIAKFCEKVAHLFESAHWYEGVGKMSPGRLTLHSIESLLVDGASRGKVLSHIEQTLRHMEERWGAVTQSYAAVTLHCLKR